MSFTDQKPFVVTEADMLAPWNGYRDGRTFRCFLCGDFFGVGDIVRWIYTNSTPGCSAGNPFVCAACDGPDALDRIVAHSKIELDPRYWWLRDRDRLPANPNQPARKAGSRA